MVGNRRQVDPEEIRALARSGHGIAPDLGRQLARRYRLPLHPQPPSPAELANVVDRRRLESSATVMRPQRTLRPRGLRGAIGHIPTGDMDQPRPQHLAGRRAATLQQRPQLTARRGAIEPQRPGAAARPLPCRLAPHRVAVLGPAGDLALVVLLVPSRQLAQAHHGGLRKIVHTPVERPKPPTPPSKPPTPHRTRANHSYVMQGALGALSMAMAVRLATVLRSR